MLEKTRESSPYSNMLALATSEVKSTVREAQGFPILINRAMTSKESLNGQIDMSIEKTSLAG
ncbi:MAG: hypothetical protein WCD86_14910, partial [Ktedonobacteraceae bacterium]